tara:strand:- start:376 stop:864 length:489 start_codon:yes stop_codon:yes gene_type:complete
MDFPDLTEYIGPIIFGLIAWLSNYFSKKKKPSDGEVLDKKKKEESFSNDLSELYNKITSPEKVEEVREEINVYPEIKDPIIEKEILDETISVNTAEVETDLINKEKEETDEAIIESINDKKKIDESRKKTTNSRNNIRDKIKSKNGLKEAFILKEILDRKYD